MSNCLHVDNWSMIYKKLESIRCADTFQVLERQGLQGSWGNPEDIFVTPKTYGTTFIVILLQELELVFGHTDARKDAQT